MVKFQLDPVLGKIEMDLQRLMYRYLSQSEEHNSPEEKSSELKISLMGLSQVNTTYMVKSAYINKGSTVLTEKTSVAIKTFVPVTIFAQHKRRTEIHKLKLSVKTLY